jgi:hypothetical protein
MIFADVSPMSDEPDFRLTEDEMSMLAALAEVRASADTGDKKAKTQMTKLERQVVLLTKRARHGDAKAARRVRVLYESGILQSSQRFAM